MRQDQPVMDVGGRLQTVAVLTSQLAAASDIFERMVGSSRNVTGVGFIMLDESCGQIALLMDGFCAQIAAQVQRLGGDADWPVRVLKVHSAVCVSRVPAVIEDGCSAGLLDAFSQSLIEAVTVAEAKGEKSSADLLTRVWRDIDRNQWQIIPQNPADIELLISFD